MFKSISIKNSAYIFSLINLAKFMFLASAGEVVGGKINSHAAV